MITDNSPNAGYPLRILYDHLKLIKDRPQSNNNQVRIRYLVEAILLLEERSQFYEYRKMFCKMISKECSVRDSYCESEYPDCKAMRGFHPIIADKDTKL